MAFISEATVALVAGIAVEADRIETPCGDGAMVWRCWGGGPPLVLLHGGYGSWMHWIRNVLPLSRQFRVIAPDLPGHGQEFIPLARSCAGWENVQAQQVWLGSFDEMFVGAEPRPLCAFLSGNFKDWCEIAREPWRGTEQVMKRGHLPMWASCGGAQASHRSSPCRPRI